MTSDLGSLKPVVDVSKNLCSRFVIFFSSSAMSNPSTQPHHAHVNAMTGGPDMTRKPAPFTDAYRAYLVPNA